MEGYQGKSTPSIGIGLATSANAASKAPPFPWLVPCSFRYLGRSIRPLRVEAGSVGGCGQPDGAGCPAASDVRAGDAALAELGGSLPSTKLGVCKECDGWGPPTPCRCTQAVFFFALAHVGTARYFILNDLLTDMGKQRGYGRGEAVRAGSLAGLGLASSVL